MVSMGCKTWGNMKGCQGWRVIPSDYALNRLGVRTKLMLSQSVRMERDLP